MAVGSFLRITDDEVQSSLRNQRERELTGEESMADALASRLGLEAQRRTLRDADLEELRHACSLAQQALFMQMITLTFCIPSALGQQVEDHEGFREIREAVLREMFEEPMWWAWGSQVTPVSRTSRLMLIAIWSIAIVGQTYQIDEVEAYVDRLRGWMQRAVDPGGTAAALPFNPTGLPVA